MGTGQVNVGNDPIRTPLILVKNLEPMEERNHQIG